MTLNAKFHSQSVYEKKYMKTKVKTKEKKGWLVDFIDAELDHSEWLDLSLY